MGPPDGAGRTFSIEDAERHLRRVDAVVAGLIDQHGPFRPRPSGDPYESLLRAILFQQLAGAAASAIQRRFLALYGMDGRYPSPRQLLDTADEALKGAGVSRQKAAYMKDLALHAADGRLDFSALPDAPDDSVIEALTAVKGIGVWSAQMFLMFQLGRPDVLPVGDLGVRNGMRIAYGLPATPAPREAEAIGAPWAPFRSVGSWYMWRAAETKLMTDA